MVKTVLVAVAALALLVVAGCGTGPDAPTNLTVTSTSPITLSWHAVSGATSYKVYRGTSSGVLSTKTLLASGVTVTTYQDTSAASGSTYYYQVTAMNSDGTSAASNEVNASPSGSSFAVVGTVANSQITLTWSAVTNAVNYNVYRGTTSAVITNKTKIKSGVTTTTFTDTDVKSGTTYYYQVTAVNSGATEFQISSETTALSF